MPLKKVVKSAARTRKPITFSNERSEPVFYLAEDVRIEQGGKISMLGFFSNSTIQIHLPPGTPNPTREKVIGIGSLSVLSAYHNVPGTHTIKFRLAGPDGTVIAETVEGSIAPNAGDTGLNLISRFSPMPLIAFGTYSFSSILDGHVDTFTFTVVRGADAAKGDSATLQLPVFVGAGSFLPGVAKNTKKAAKKVTKKAVKPSRR